MLILCTTDKRLCAKAEFYTKESGIPIFLLTSPESLTITCLQEIFRREEALSAPQKKRSMPQSVCIDLDSKEFLPEHLKDVVREISSVFPAVQILAFTLTLEPNTVQRAKLLGITQLLQRFSFEDLLKKLAGAWKEGLET
ncbi:MAG: hypothetical protein EAZ92_16905 [Candidatus Kapaibacterium sp.]|nr:MAG: hypothetical protein EAZ92_16905 [Candidatus Kapabacteria bacterium]